VDPVFVDVLPVDEGEMSLEVDSPSIGAHSHHLLAYAVGARSTGVAHEEQQFQNGAIRSPENKITSLDHQTCGDRMLESSINDGHREGQGNARRGHRVSPVQSLHQARERAVTVAHRSEFLRREQTQIERRQRKSRNFSCRTYGDTKNGTGSHDFRSYETPFTQRVREKLRRVHEAGEGIVGLHASIEGSELNCEPETLTLTASARRVLPEEILESTGSSVPSASCVSLSILASQPQDL
jgi:hypothetical protein